MLHVMATAITMGMHRNTVVEGLGEGGCSDGMMVDRAVLGEQGNRVL